MQLYDYIRFPVKINPTISGEVYAIIFAALGAFGVLGLFPLATLLFTCAPAAVRLLLATLLSVLLAGVALSFLRALLARVSLGILFGGLALGFFLRCLKWRVSFKVEVVIF